MTTLTPHAFTLTRTRYTDGHPDATAANAAHTWHSMTRADRLDALRDAGVEADYSDLRRAVLGSWKHARRILPPSAINLLRV